MSQSNVASSNPGAKANGNEVLNKKEGSLPGPAAPSPDSCCTVISGRPRQFDSSFSSTEDGSDAESESHNSTVSLASLSPANDQPSLQQPSKSTSALVDSSGLSNTVSTMNSEIEETSQFLSSLAITRTVESDEQNDCGDGNNDGERTDIDDIERSYTIESFEDDE
ncbi:hypothetical protein TcWFU_000562 [Taenia crassiceps]|uniref:Uncharacterized protein n=1 Tax=Taenia crassiceps TaxID=6207 RepID=A0ABR4QNE1_9CEST